MPPRIPERAVPANVKELSPLFDNNRAWAARIRAEDPHFFEKLSRQQGPQYFWIGCSDSRVPANQITGLLPGELFVHRNVANVVPPKDLNCMSALQFAVDVLQVKHVIVCGHYECAGVRAVLRDEQLGLVDQWLEPIREVCRKHARDLACLKNDAQRLDRLCELNIHEQVARVCEAESVQRAWAAGRALAVHGWIYSVKDGLLRDLGLCIQRPPEPAPA
jgi:carbonic anhydrase